jgi:hypothetical protein
MIQIKIETQRALTVNGNWGDFTITVQPVCTNPATDDFCVKIHTIHGDMSFTVEEIKAIAKFAEDEFGRLQA